MAVRRHRRTVGQRSTSLRSLGTYSRKIGMWLFLLSGLSDVWGAALCLQLRAHFIANWPTPFHSESIVNATIMTAFLLTSSLTMVLAVRAAVHAMPKRSASGFWHDGLRHGICCSSRTEWSHLIATGLTLPVFRRCRTRNNWRVCGRSQERSAVFPQPSSV